MPALYERRSKLPGGKASSATSSFSREPPSYENVSSAARRRSSVFQSNMSISMKRNRPGDRSRGRRACRGLVYAVRKSGSRAAFDGADLIGGDLVKMGPAVRIVGEPAFGGLAIPGEMQEFRAFADVLQDADHADRRTLDDLETQIALDGQGASDRDDDGAALAESPSCKVKQAGEL